MYGEIKIIRQIGDEAYHYWKMFPDTWVVQYGEALYCYLLIGGERAMLIDTAYGRGDFPNVIARLTDKPILLVNTHGHYDHTGGNAWFSEAWMHPEAEKIARRNFRPIDEMFWANMPYPDYQIRHIEDGHVFDLGGRRVGCIYTPAHADSSITYLDHGQKILFPGDEFDSGQANLRGIESVKSFLINMQKLRSHWDEYDYILPQHNGGPIAKCYIDDFIQNAKDILAGHPHFAPINDAPGSSPGPENRHRSRLNHASINYNDPD
jgi:glyoxylase-like metal-dependent hydrolase (beta-lactamase superfamily II)